MYEITKKQWLEMKRKHPDCVGTAIFRHEFNGKVCEAGDGVCFECCIPGAPNTGAALLFEHIHFEIIG